MKLYYSPGTCSLAPHIALIEAGQGFTIERVDLKSKHFAGGDFNVVNPKGSVPALVLDNGDVLTEGAMLLQYIADLAPGTGLAPKAGTMERYRLQEWLNYIATEIHKNFSMLFNADRYVANAEGNAQLKDAVKENLRKRFTFVASRMGDGPYLMGESFTVADAYLFTVLRWTKPFQLDLAQWPQLSRFMERMRERPSAAQALKAESPK